MDSSFVARLLVSIVFRWDEIDKPCSSAKEIVPYVDVLDQRRQNVRELML
jgi:hypothetical protein